MHMGTEGDARGEGHTYRPWSPFSSWAFVCVAAVTAEKRGECVGNAQTGMCVLAARPRSAFTSAYLALRARAARPHTLGSRKRFNPHLGKPMVPPKHIDVSVGRRVTTIPWSS